MNRNKHLSFKKIIKYSVDKTNYNAILNLDYFKAIDLVPQGILIKTPDVYRNIWTKNWLTDISKCNFEWQDIHELMCF